MNSKEIAHKKISELVESNTKTDNMKLGRLEKLDLRTFWKREATEFTPWLGDNLTVFGASLFGIFIGSFLSASASIGVEYIFPEEDVELWGILLWGDHWLLRLFVSLSSTILGAFAVGLIVSNKTKIASIFSAIPTVILFAGGGIFMLYSLGSIDSPSLGSWLTIILVSTLSIPLANYAAQWGSSYREDNHYLFGQPHRPLGVHWSTLIWIWIPYYLLYADLWYSFYYLIYLSFLDDWKFVLIIGRILLYLAFICQGYGLLQGLWYLSSGKHQGLSNLQVTGKVFVNVICLPVLGMGLRAVGFLILSVKESLPSWVYIIMKLFTAH